ncbi:hypothetical protein CUMW_201380 [Citrus unshiu]|uniref:Dormancy/auxin associated family protein n=1 Tax=Citrus unshiu TaxID=55188 RepID=A0A2H5Q6U4_CITUN|nr:hypothetical protein CUMW_201380 [Citrus unshiu]
MGFLHKLWDETLAGPTPDSGLGKLRKYDSFSSSSSSSASRPRPVVADHDHVVISRSITILRTNANSNFRNLSGDPGSAPDSPSGSCSSPRTPLTPGTPPGDFKRFTRRKPLAQALEERAEPRSPTVYDWIVISALDR